MEEAEQLSEKINVSAACQALGVPRSSYYREKKARPSADHPTPSRALTPDERVGVREVLNGERFQDQTPRDVYAALLDEGIYLCHWRTMYRILAEYDEVRERRNQLRHPKCEKPELLATGPNQVWSWDITKLLGPVKWTYYYLYVILDIYSRYVVGWMIAGRETANLAKELIAQTTEKHAVDPEQLTIHADRGGPMIAKSLALLMADLGVNKSHSRPHNSNDNPYSEAQFKTMKYRLGYPDRFGSQPDARVWARSFFDWYNNEHHHSALGLMTPADVHFGRAPIIIQQRQKVLSTAYQEHPERFVNGPPIAPQLPKAVWINPPEKSKTAPRGFPLLLRSPVKTISDSGGCRSPNPVMSIADSG